MVWGGLRWFVVVCGNSTDPFGCHIIVANIKCPQILRKSLIVIIKCDKMRNLFGPNMVKGEEIFGLLEFLSKIA